MNRAQLQQLTADRLADANALLDGGRWSFAYYVAGYAVECALKACVLSRMVYTGWVFQEKANVRDCLTHDFNDLIKLAGLRPELDAHLAAEAAAGTPFPTYWGVAEQWQVESRYVVTAQAEAERLYEAITHDPHGVLKWIQNYW